MKLRKKYIDFIEILTKNKFHISNACIEANISRQLYYDWLEKVEGFKQAVENAKMYQVDMAESMLYGKVLDKDFQSIKFFLQHNYPEKYRETVRSEHSGPGGGAIETDSTVTIIIKKDEY